MVSEKRRIERFSESLALALFDKKLELNKIPVLFFFDADVIFKLVMGFEHHDYPEPKTGYDKQRLVRGLLSCGYLGAFHMVRSHAFEFYEKLRPQRMYRTKADHLLFYQKVNNYIYKTGIQKDMQELGDIISEKKGRLNKSEDALVEDFLSVLRERPGETFAHIEQINGTWSQRIRRYYDNELFKLDQLGPEISDLVIDYRDLLQEANRIIREERPRFTINAFQDAAAIIILYNFILENERKNIDFLVRFYTETSSVEEIIKHDHTIHKILTYNDYESFIDNVPTDGNFIYRDSDYFIMRTMFNELSPIATNIIDFESLRSLEELSFRLQELLLSPDENIEKSLSSIMLNGKTLLDLIESFEKLSIMEPLWVRRRMPEILRDYESLARWIEVFKFAQENRTEAILHEQVRDIRNKLESQVSKIRTWTHDYRVILRAGRSKAERFANKIEDPMRDLGLVRWDYDLSEEEKNEVVETLENLTSGDESDLNDTAPLVATKMEIARVDTKACQIMCAVLWALNRFREIVSLVDECRANSLQRFPATLTIIQGAAQMKMGGIPSRMDRRLVVERSLKLMGDMPKTKKKGILLGVGYILYHAWKQEMVGKSVRERQLINQPQEVREWADKSFEVGEEAYQSFEQNTLPWAYAVNHCAYVGIVTGVKPQKTVEYLQILFRLKGYSAIWSPRFDDTIGCYYLVRAENAWGTSNEIDKRKLDLKEDLDNARRYLEEAAKNDPGDIDIDEHLGRLDVISNEYFSQKNRAKDS